MNKERQKISLPIDPLLDGLRNELERSRSAVLEAAPGAGKTTRVPPAMLNAKFLEGREILVLEPRRLAAKMAATRVADELGERVGETIGYHFRFENVAGPRTRIRFLTEGMFVRRMLGDPSLKNVGLVIVDEFHERHLQGDFALAALKRLQTTTRPDLRILVMSATLDTAAVAAYLDGAREFRSEGRAYDVAVEYLNYKDTYLERQVAGAIKHVLQKSYEGDILVFLPGVAEIRRAAQELEPLADDEDILLVQLYGDLTREEQDRAVRPADRRKIILSTNVAETSLTIEGVRIVVDSGLARVASHSWWSGLPALSTKPVSRASAIQRMGRAGRTAPGHCVRLYGKDDFDARPSYEVAEILRADLAQTCLELQTLGVNDPAVFPWFEVPQAAAVQAAQALLRRLNALDERGVITELGRRMARIPTHPRIARLVLEGERLGVFREACTAAALLSEGRVEGIDFITAAERVSLTGTAARMRDQLLRVSGEGGGAKGDLRKAILAAYPDRAARRRQLAAHISRNNSGQKIELVLSGGGAALVENTAAVAHSEYFVALDIEERKTGTQKHVLVRTLCSIEPEWLFDLSAPGVTETVDVRWDSGRERVEVVQRMSYEAITLDEAVVPKNMFDESIMKRVAEVLAGAATQAGLAKFCDPDELALVVERVKFVAGHMPELGLPNWSVQALQNLVRDAAMGCSSFEDLRQANLPELLLGQLSSDLRAKLDKLAPTFVLLTTGRRVKVHYNEGKPPWIESRLQDFFGMNTGPTVLAGRVPLVLHLLAPNQRAVQVTSDLSGFWTRNYPDLRKELGRRYPRHAWPEDPLHISRTIKG